MTTLVVQRVGSDCSICAIAMLSGRAYEEIVELAGKDYDPNKGMWSVQGTLERLGLSHAYENGQPIGDFVQLHKGFEISAEFFRSLAWGRRALISVPSLNIPGGFHMVYCDGRTVFDPSPKQRYERFDQLLPVELVLFREAGGGQGAP